MKDTTFIRVRYIYQAFVFALFVWVTDSLIDFYFFYEESFWDVVFFNIPKSELYHRIVFMVMIVFYVIMHGWAVLRLHGNNIELNKAHDELIDKEKQLIRSNDILKANNIKFKNYLDFAPYGIIAVSKKGNILLTNKAMIAFVGFSKGEMMEMNFLDFLPSYAKKMGADLLQSIVENGGGGADLPYVTKLNKTLFWKVKAVKLDDGQLLIFVKDITENLEAVKNIRETEKRFCMMLNDIENVGVQGYDKDRKVTFWNKASERMYGYTMEEAVGQKLEDLIIPDEIREGIVAGINNWHENNEPIPHGPLVLKNKEGESVHVYSSHVMINKQNGSKEMFCIDIKTNSN